MECQEAKHLKGKYDRFPIWSSHESSNGSPEAHLRLVAGQPRGADSVAGMAHCAVSTHRAALAVQCQRTLRPSLPLVTSPDNRRYTANGRVPTRRGDCGNAPTQRPCLRPRSR